MRSPGSNSGHDAYCRTHPRNQKDGPLGSNRSSRVPMARVDSSRICSASQNSKRRSEEHTSELQSRGHLVCRLLLEKKKHQSISTIAQCGSTKLIPLVSATTHHVSPNHLSIPK